MGSVTQEIPLCAGSASPSARGPGRRRAVRVLWSQQRLFLPPLLQVNAHLLCRRPAPGMRSTLVLGPISSCVHTSRQIEHRFITETASLCVDENGVQGGQDYFNLPSPPKEGRWFFSEGNLK